MIDTALEIEDYTPARQGDFERLNREWLERYFTVEDIDRRVLSDPQGEIIAHGGAIVFAVTPAAVVGTCALKHHGDGVFELTKMAVTAQAQRHGVGRRLLAAAVARFHLLGGSRLYLESHRSLAAALHLYETAGFAHAPRPDMPSFYARSDVYMIYRSDEDG